MRGLAAVAVAFYHTHLILGQHDRSASGLLAAVTTRGWLGVNFFFVLSGFIIMYAHARDIGRPARAGRYIWRRFSRVYPVYWLFLSAYIGAAALGLGNPDFAWDPLNLTSAYLLVQLKPIVSLPLQVAWTLFCEVSFYIAFLFLILNRAVGIGVILLWVAAIVAVGPIGGVREPGWFIHSWNLYFLAGMAAYAGFRRLDGRHGVPLLGLGVALLVLCLGLGLVDPRIATAMRVPGRLLLLAVPFTFILLGAALAEQHHGWRYPRWLLLLGDASYAVYLVHSAVISLVAAKAVGVFAPLPPVLLYLLLGGLGIVAGVLAHLMVERPLLAWLRHVDSVKKRNAPLPGGERTV